jgi:hypothetical protein
LKGGLPTVVIVSGAFLVASAQSWITGLLAVCEAELERLVTARQVVGELPAVHVAAAVPDRPALPTPRTGSAEVREIGQDAAAPFAEQVLKVLAGHAGPVRCRAGRRGAGPGDHARNVERVRQRLKKAAAAGVVVKTPGSLFTLARVPAGAGR